MLQGAQRRHACSAHRRQLLAGVLQKPELALDSVHDEADRRCTCAHQAHARHQRALIPSHAPAGPDRRKKGSSKDQRPPSLRAPPDIPPCKHGCGGGQATGDHQADLGPCCHGRDFRGRLYENISFGLFSELLHCCRLYTSSSSPPPVRALMMMMHFICSCRNNK